MPFVVRIKKNMWLQVYYMIVPLCYLNSLCVLNFRIFCSTRVKVGESELDPKNKKERNRARSKHGPYIRW